MRTRACASRAALLALALVLCGCLRLVKNQLPVISIEASPTFVKAQIPVTFTITASDPDGGGIEIYVDFGDGVRVYDVGATLTHAFAAEGVYVVTATARDAAGTRNYASVTVTVTPSSGPPSVRLDAATLHIQVTGGPAEEMRVDGAPYPLGASQQADVVRPLADTVTTVTLEAADAAGNAGSRALRFEILP